MLLLILIKKMVSKKIMKNIIITGNVGTGKTSFVKLFIDKFYDSDQIDIKNR
jgi:tRNA A37 threonylcarbamoyladenosine biosynthesis protein TsaE